jgi:hypothetical protein
MLIYYREINNSFSFNKLTFTNKMLEASQHLPNIYQHLPTKCRAGPGRNDSQKKRVHMLKTKAQCRSAEPPVASVDQLARAPASHGCGTPLATELAKLVSFFQAAEFKAAKQRLLQA